MSRMHARSGAAPTNERTEEMRKANLVALLSLTAVGRTLALAQQSRQGTVNQMPGRLTRCISGWPTTRVRC